MNYDIAIIGSGSIGLSIAYELSSTDKKIIVIEKEKSFGHHTSSRNSQVIHSGVYYPKNSKKAIHCIRGNKMIYDFCKMHSIRYKNTGKIIIAQNDRELKKIEILKENGERNGLTNLKIYKKNDLLNIEPNLKAKYGLFIPSTGIFDAHQFMSRLEYLSSKKGVDFLYQYEVTNIDISNDITSVYFNNDEKIKCHTLINAAGLWSDKIGNMINKDKYKLMYYKGDYYTASKCKNIFSHLIYPLPTDFSLGIHAVLDLEGNVGFGPNAYPVSEIDYANNDYYKKDFYNNIKKYVDIDFEDLKIDFSGIRPKISCEDNSFQDFIIDYGNNNIVNLVGIESPGLTSSLSIAKEIKEKLIFENDR